jgi:hypothetical protein
MYNKEFKGHKHLKTFGEMCVVTTKKAIQGKLSDRGTVGLLLDILIIMQMMFTGYSTFRPNKSSSQEI